MSTDNPFFEPYIRILNPQFRNRENMVERKKTAGIAAGGWNFNSKV